MAVARSFSRGSAIRYKLPVLWMTSCFHVMQGIGQNQRRVDDAYVLSPGSDARGEVCRFRLHAVSSWTE